MAQKREKEETELKVPETVTLCTPPIPTPPKLSGNDDPISTPSRSSETSDLPEISIIRETAKLLGAADSRSRRSERCRSQSKEEERDSDDRPKRREVLRCCGCKRKVGLTGFRCRCGELFCSEHRYSDRHDCSFDYKAAGREAIARENPVVRAAKILKV